MESITKDEDANVTPTQNANKVSSQTQSHQSTGKTFFMCKQRTMCFKSL